MSNDDVATVERVIPAPPERIFALLADASRHKDFDGSGTVKGTDHAEPLRLGSRFGMSMRIVAPYSMVSTVVEYEENRRIAWQPKPAYPLINRIIGGRIWRYELEPVDGGTLVRESWDITHEPLKFAVRPQRGVTIRNMTATLERLEELLAASPA
jgi:uncharacterized protein YndB with AHSA1/START domain